MGIAESKAKFASKVRVMPANYTRGMSQFFGADVSRSAPVRSYVAKVTPQMVDKWEANLKNSFGL